MTQLNVLESRVERLELRVDRMVETLATTEDIENLRTVVKDDVQTLREEVREQVKILHDRLNSQNVVILTGFIITIASVVITRLLS